MSSDPRLEDLQNRYTNKIARVANVLATDPRTKKTIRRAQREMKWSGLNVSLETAAERMVEEVFRDLSELDERLNGVKIVLVEDEFPEAGTVHDTKYFPYIHISTSLLGLLSELVQVQADLGSNKMRRRRPLETQIAALRYLALQWSFHGLSGTIGRTSSLRFGSWSSYSYRLMYAATSFILAHETAHILLGHDHTAVRDMTESHKLEYEADAYGLELLHRMPLIRNKSDVTSGAMLVLDGFDFTLRSQWVIPPQSHPSTAKRIDNLVQRDLLQPTDLDEVMSKVAWASSDTVESLPSEFWQDLLSSRHWVTNFHAEQVYASIVNIDMMCGMDEDTLSSALQETLKEANRQDIDINSALRRIMVKFDDTSYGLSLQDIDEIVSTDPEISTVGNPYQLACNYTTEIIVRNRMLSKEG